MPIQELKSETTHEGRVYITPTGERYESVTTRLGKAFPSPWLDEWKAKVGDKEATRISNIATRRGSSIHLLSEKYLLNDSRWFQGAMPINLESFNGIKSILDEYVDEIYGIELPLYSHVLKTAGRTDLVAKFDENISIIDFKTSKKLKNSNDILTYFLQATCYAMMFEELYSIPINNITIIMAVDHEGVQVFRRKTEKYRQQVLKIFC